ncbi:hypothetical protein QYE76_049185 [Lolium multiflorum]|uniref:Uncharacterized protein n=1 Tax=Lolium multiflorum TaxID=4521 RepID=A0AAD8SPH8_LOLMU|nr:hypothetical protein QYE76_049185 [Lolium multiflorum]
MPSTTGGRRGVVPGEEDLVSRLQNAEEGQEVRRLDQRISKILEMFHIANMILIVKTNRTAPALQQRVPASSSSAADVKEMVSLAVSIVEEAKKQRHNREEIQQLVQFVEQVANLLQQLQSANLWWDAKTKLLLDGLKGLLQQASNILFHHKQPHRSNTRMQQAFFCTGGGYYSQDEPDQILQVAYGIGYYVQLVPTMGPAAALAGVHSAGLLTMRRAVVTALFDRVLAMDFINDNTGCFANGGKFPKNGRVIEFGSLRVYYGTVPERSASRGAGGAGPAKICSSQRPRRRQRRGAGGW